MWKLFLQILSYNYLRSVLLGLFLGLIIPVTYVLGFISHSVWFFEPNLNVELSSSRETTRSYDLLLEVERLIETVYLRELPDEESLEYAAIRGMLESLNDPATFFIEPPVALSESQALAGTYGGIGVQVKRSESGDFILFPFQDGPAFKAGVMDNDILLKINDVDIISEFTIDEIDQLLRGEVGQGNGVTLNLLTISETSKEVFVEFDVISIPSVISRLTAENDNIGYIQILKFTSRTPDELEDVLSQMVADNISALVLDLRNNSGGLLVESIEVADQFLDEGVIVIEKSRDTTEAYSAESGSVLTDIPIVILVNNRTASASELVAGALRDNGHGILMGQQTFGKGTVQQIFPLSDGSSIHVTSAEWFTPSEQSIASNGLQPDILLIADANGRDVEFGEAIRYLTSILSKQEK